MIWDSLEVLIREGRLGEASELLKGIPLRGLPRKEVRLFASFCRRCGLYLLGLRALSPIIRNDYSRSNPKPAEVVEYSANLLRLGATEEAIERLRQVEPNDEPNSLLFLAFCLFSRWQYE